MKEKIEFEDYELIFVRTGLKELKKTFIGMAERFEGESSDLDGIAEKYKGFARTCSDMVDRINSYLD